MTKHHPTVVSNRCVIEQIWLDNPVHLDMVEVVGNALIETLADVAVVRCRVGFAVTCSVAPAWATAVGNPRTDIFVVRIGDREFVVERVVESHQPGPYVD